MFADDTMSATEDRVGIKRAIVIIETEAAALELKINKKKSGIMVIYKQAGGGRRQEGEVFGYPLVNDYKYLGTWMNQTLSPASHLEKAARKVSYVTGKLAPLRRQLNMKFNVRLFKTLIMPSIRMVGVLYKTATESWKGKIVRTVNRMFRTFCMLPWTCPNELV